MATGRSNQITKQVGEYLVASKLGRLGLVVATFSGNVPEYDIIATDATFRSVPVQVKTTNGNSWQFDIRAFVDIQLDGKKQLVGLPVDLPVNIVWVFVALSRDGNDRFYVVSLKTLQEMLIGGHRDYLAKFGGIRPKKFDSFHGAIKEEKLASFRNAWISEFRDKQGLTVYDPTSVLNDESSNSRNHTL